MDFHDPSLLFLTFSTIILFGFLNCLVQIYKARLRIVRLRKQGMPMPPWNPVFGHLLFCYRVTSSLPKDAHPGYIIDMIRRELPDIGSMYYLDTWPFGPQMLIVTSTYGLHQFTQEHSLPKYPALKYFIQPIAEGMDLVTMEGDIWKTWRGIFNPGFSTAYLANLTHGIVEETEQFCQRLRDLSRSGDMFRMKILTDFLTMDVIGRVVMNVRFDSQRQSNPLVDGLRMQVQWLTFNPSLMKYNPVRPFVIWYNSRRMNKYVTPRIERRFSELQRGEKASNKSILDLVLSTYLSENNGKDLNPVFKKFTMNQVKLFLFSGHDTTSSTVGYIFYILASNPEALAPLCDEHASIFGKDVSKIASLVKSDPFILNKLHYTHAFIKEVMRLYPAVSAIRYGEQNFYIVDERGRSFPTADFLVWDNAQAIHREPSYWPKADEFIPERWLMEPGHSLHPVHGAWRAFSHGPRNCIGQELAMLEMKVIIVMTARTFDFKLAYDELDHTSGIKKAPTVYGERAYQIGRAQPSNDLPCYVSLKEV